MCSGSMEATICNDELTIALLINPSTAPTDSTTQVTFALYIQTNTTPARPSCIAKTRKEYITSVENFISNQKTRQRLR